MNKTVTIDFVAYGRCRPPRHRQRASAVAARPAPWRGAREPAHGSRHSRHQPAVDQLAIYEAGGGSTSFLPLRVLRPRPRHRGRYRRGPDPQQQLCAGNHPRRHPDPSFRARQLRPRDLLQRDRALPDVEAALLGFCESLKQGGLILIGAPNPKSLSGVVTKYSPHWFHVWFYRHVRGDKKAGLPGQAPFPTFFHPLVTLAKLEAFAKAAPACR